VSAEDLAAEVEEKRSERYFRRALVTETILVAEADGALVGYVEFGDRSIHRLYVETAHQGRGIGRELVQAALSHPRLRAAPRVSLEVWDQNARAIALYESLGFRTVGTTPVTIGRTEVGEDLVMVLERVARL
jgi:ribosomal protein S18 acetylase RimI-like enzyme